MFIINNIYLQTYIWMTTILKNDFAQEVASVPGAAAAATSASVFVPSERQMVDMEFHFSMAMMNLLRINERNMIQKIFRMTNTLFALPNLEQLQLMAMTIAMYSHHGFDDTNEVVVMCHNIYNSLAQEDIQRLHGILTLLVEDVSAAPPTLSIQAFSTTSTPLVEEISTPPPPPPKTPKDAENAKKHSPPPPPPLTQARQPQPNITEAVIDDRIQEYYNSPNAEATEATEATTTTRHRVEAIVKRIIYILFVCLFVFLLIHGTLYVNRRIDDAIEQHITQPNRMKLFDSSYDTVLNKNVLAYLSQYEKAKRKSISQYNVTHLETQGRRFENYFVRRPHVNSLGALRLEHININDSHAAVSDRRESSVFLIIQAHSAINTTRLLNKELRESVYYWSDMPFEGSIHFKTPEYEYDMILKMKSCIKNSSSIDEGMSKFGKWYFHSWVKKQLKNIYNRSGNVSLVPDVNDASFWHNNIVHVVNDIMKNKKLNLQSNNNPSLQNQIVRRMHDLGLFDESFLALANLVDDEIFKRYIKRWTSYAVSVVLHQPNDTIFDTKPFMSQEQKNDLRRKYQIVNQGVFGDLYYDKSFYFGDWRNKLNASILTTSNLNPDVIAKLQAMTTPILIDNNILYHNETSFPDVLMSSHLPRIPKHHRSSSVVNKTALWQMKLPTVRHSLSEIVGMLKGIGIDKVYVVDFSCNSFRDDDDYLRYPPPKSMIARLKNNKTVGGRSRRRMHNTRRRKTTSIRRQQQRRRRKSHRRCRIIGGGGQKGDIDARLQMLDHLLSNVSRKIGKDAAASDKCNAFCSWKKKAGKAYTRKVMSKLQGKPYHTPKELANPPKKYLKWENDQCRAEYCDTTCEYKRKGFPDLAKDIKNTGFHKTFSDAQVKKLKELGASSACGKNSLWENGKFVLET